MRGYQRQWAAESRANGERLPKWKTTEELTELKKKQSWSPSSPEMKKDGWQRRRAQKLEAPTENFRHEEIYRRDGWVCQLCKKKVDKKLTYPDDMSASLDHKKPLSRGGHHTRANVQLAHLKCNLAKGARYG